MYIIIIIINKSGRGDSEELKNPFTLSWPVVESTPTSKAFDHATGYKL